MGDLSSPTHPLSSPTFAFARSFSVSCCFPSPPAAASILSLGFFFRRQIWRMYRALNDDNIPFVSFPLSQDKSAFYSHRQVIV